MVKQKTVTLGVFKHAEESEMVKWLRVEACDGGRRVRVQELVIFLSRLWCAIHPSQVLAECMGLKILRAHCVFAHSICSPKIPLCLLAKNS